ncbi:TPA: phage tail tape measure protein [Clostridioides difficile]|nr:phage tail tape measure protein [Clostridioides difficile]HBF3268136.1 phage tail tape measure protein [Clostridioides difficile]HBF4500729.1 phage tail tape measure protein [Clostridioides difficile]
MSSNTKVLQAIIKMRDEASSTLKRVAANTRALHDSSSQASRTLNNVQSNLKSVGTSALKAGGLITAGVGGAFAAATKVGTEFESAMSQVKATFGNSLKPGDFEALSKAARDAGKATTKTAADSANALQYMGLAGWDVQKSMHALMPVLNLSEAASMDLGLASDLVTDSMSSMCLEVDKVSKSGKVLAGAGLSEYLDKVANASTKSNTSIQQLMEAFNVAGGTFSNLKVPLSEATAIMGILANRGVKGTDAGHALNSIMVNLTTGAGQAGKAMKKLGVSAFDNQGKFKGMSNVLKEVANKTKDMTDKQKNYYLAAIGGKTQLKTLQKLLDGVGNEYDSLKKKIDNSKGALKTMSDVMKDNTKGGLATLKSALEETGITIYYQLKPAIASVVDNLTKMTVWFNNLSEPIKRVITNVMLSVGAFGVLLLTIGAVSLIVSKAIGIFGFFVPIILRAKVAFRAFVIGMKPLSAVFLAVMGPIGWTITAVIALSVAFTIAYAKSEVFRNKVNSLVKSFTEFAKPIVNFCMPALKQLGEKFKELLSAFGPLFASILNLGSVIMKVLGPVLIGVIGFHIAKLVLILSTLATAFKAVVDTITNVLNGLASILNGVFNLIIGIVTGDSKKMMNGVKQIFDGGVKIIKSIWKGFIDFVTAPIQAIADIADSLFKDKAKWLTDKWRDLRTFLENPIEATAKISAKTNVNIPGSKAADAAGKSTPNTGGLKQTVANLKGSFSDFKTFIKPMTDSISQGVESGKSKFTELQNKILNDVKPALKVLEDSGVNFKNKFKESITSIKDKFNELKDILAGNIKTNIDNLVKAFEPLKPHLDNLKECFDKVKKAITDFFTPAKQVGDTVNKVSQPMDSVKKSTDGIKLSFQSLTQALAPVKAWFQGFMPFLSQIGQQLLPSIGIAIAGVVGGIILAFTWVLNTLTAIITTVSGIINGIMSFISGIINVIMGLITGNADQTMDGLKQIFDSGVGVIKSIWNGLVDLVSGVLEPVIDLADSFFKDKVKGVKEAWNKLKEFFHNPIKGMIEIVKSGPSLQIGKGADAAGKSPRKAFGINRVPRNDYLIRAHEGEKLLTKQEANQYKRNSSNGSLFLDKLADTIIVREEADIDKIVRKINKKISLAKVGGVL